MKLSIYIYIYIYIYTHTYTYILQINGSLSAAFAAVSLINFKILI